MEHLRSPINPAFVKQWARPTTPEAADGCGRETLEVTVIFTDAPSTLAALKTAGTLADRLGARIKLVVPQAVPYAYPLDRPPVSVAFTEKLLFDLAWRAAQASQEIAVYLHLCRDRLQTILEVLEPNSLVVIGGRKRWWPTAERRLARALRAKGHEVIFANLK